MQSIEGELYIVGEIAGYPEFNHHVKLFLFDVARHHKLPDFDLVLSTSDACHTPGKFNGSAKACPSMVRTASSHHYIIRHCFKVQMAMPSKRSCMQWQSVQAASQQNYCCAWFPCERQIFSPLQQAI